MEKLIIVTGAQGVGKSFYTNWLREQMRYTNLMRLTGCGDKTETGFDKMSISYFNMLNYLRSMDGSGFNFIFDGFFMSEEAFCRMGYKQYSFTDMSNLLLNKLHKLRYDKYLINLVCLDTIELERRLGRDKPGYLDNPFKLEESLKQQEIYSTVANECANHIRVEIVDTSVDEECKSTLKRILLI